MAAAPGVDQVYSSIGYPSKHYKLVKLLSCGRYGAVFRASCLSAAPDGGHTGEHVAVKFVTFPDDSSLYSNYLKAMVQKEILISNHLSAHPHIVGLLDLVVTPWDPSTRQRQVGIVMPLAKHSLQEYANRARSTALKEDLARWWFQQLVLAVDHCHSKEVGMRDIKPGNILVFKECPFIRLADFGLSKQLNEAKAMTEVGTGIYMAPDIPEGDRKQYDAMKADVWSCGVVLFQLLYPNTFEAVRKQLVAEKQVRYKDWALHLVRQVHLPDMLHEADRDAPRSEDVVDLLCRMLQGDPKARLAMPQVMEHPWFTGAHRASQHSNMPTPEDLKMLQQAAREAPPRINAGKLKQWVAAAGLPVPKVVQH